MTALSDPARCGAGAHGPDPRWSQRGQVEGQLRGLPPRLQGQPRQRGMPLGSFGQVGFPSMVYPVGSVTASLRQG